MAEYPYSEQAERAVLGSLLMNSETIVPVMAALDEDDFYNRINRTIFVAAKNVYDRNIAVDFTTVISELDATNNLEGIGGAMFLTELCEGVVTSNVEDYINVLKDKTNLRNLLACLLRTTENFNEESSGDVGEYLNRVEKEISAITRNRRVGDFKTTAEVIDVVKEKYYRSISGGVKYSGVPSGFARLDNITNGWQKGDMIVLAARPSVGKSALSLAFALNAAKTGKSVAFFSLEMPANQLVERMLSTVGHVPMEMIRKMDFNNGRAKNEMIKFEDATRKLSRYNIYIDDTPGARLIDIQAKARKLKAEKEDLCLIVIDYIGIVTLGNSKITDRQQIVAEISRGIKSLARELASKNIRVICFKILHRNSETHPSSSRKALLRIICRYHITKFIGHHIIQVHWYLITPYSISIDKLCSLNLKLFNTAIWFLPNHFDSTRTSSKFIHSSHAGGRDTFFTNTV
jgi:replicative DNA helicase